MLYRDTINEIHQPFAETDLSLLFIQLFLLAVRSAFQTGAPFEPHQLSVDGEGDPLSSVNTAGAVHHPENQFNLTQQHIFPPDHPGPCSFFTTCSGEEFPSFTLQHSNYSSSDMCLPLCPTQFMEPVNRRLALLYAPCQTAAAHLFYALITEQLCIMMHPSSLNAPRQNVLHFFSSPTFWSPRLSKLTIFHFWINN